MKMARITYKKVTSLILFSLLSISSNSYAVNPTQVISDILGSKTGSKAIDEAEGKDLGKFMKPNQCRKHYTWGAPRVKDEVVLARSLYICRGNFEVQFDPKLKIPLWSAENLTRRKLLNKNAELDAKYKPDSDLPLKMQTYPEDYLNSIYTPVQLASVYDIRSLDIKEKDPKFIQQHFNFSNTVPMVRDNLANTIWADLENQVRFLLNEKNPKGKDALYVTTGAIYLNGQTNGKLPKSGALIPTHYYKIITHPNSYGTVSYIIPNKEIYTYKTKKLNDPKNAYTCNGGPCSLANFVVPIQEVERLTNIEFYPWLAPNYAVKVKLDVNEMFKYDRREREMEEQ
jgi:DNA/RNA endonuclease G (NUC1)